MATMREKERGREEQLVISAERNLGNNAGIKSRQGLGPALPFDVNWKMFEGCNPSPGYFALR